MKTITSIFATLFLMASSATLAQEAPSFEEVDTDGNGAISSSELEEANVDIDFEDADTNDDDELTRGEYAVAVADTDS